MIVIMYAVPTVKCKSVGIIQLRSQDMLALMRIGPYTTYQCLMILDYEYKLHSLTSLLVQSINTAPGCFVRLNYIWLENDWKRKQTVKPVLEFVNILDISFPINWDWAQA